MSHTSRERFTTLLAAAVIGVYALLILGATTTITNAAQACQTWPACNGQWLAVGTPALAIVWTHRLAAIIVGLLVLYVTARAWIGAADTRVRAGITVAFLLYPVQIIVGGIAATTGATGAVSAVHLLLSVLIFAGLVLALAWELEGRTADLPSMESADVRDAPTASTPATEDADSPGPLAVANAYFRLMKPRLMWLLCLVASAGMALAAGPDLSVSTVLATLTGGVLSIGASGTFNHVLERDKDKRMNRTADRPVATHQIPIRNAIIFGVVLTAASLAAFLQVNALAAALGFAAILFYSVVYTLVLKPNTVQNTVIGGFAGSLPALIGWAAVTETVGVPALALAGVIFLWTPAHFYNLALAYKDDYERGGFPMMPVVRGEAVTRKHILLWLGATLIGSAALAAISSLGLLFAATSLGFGAVFLYAVVRLHRERDRSAAMRSFHASNAYLGFLLIAVVVDSLVL